MFGLPTAPWRARTVSQCHPIVPAPPHVVDADRRVAPDRSGVASVASSARGTRAYAATSGAVPAACCRSWNACCGVRVAAKGGIRRARYETAYAVRSGSIGLRLAPERRRVGLANGSRNVRRRNSQRHGEVVEVNRPGSVAKRLTKPPAGTRAWMTAMNVGRRAGMQASPGQDAQGASPERSERRPASRADRRRAWIAATQHTRRPHHVGSDCPTEA